MYRATSPQSSFFEPIILCPDFLPSDDWSFIYRDKIWPLLDENKFKHLHAAEGGAPNLSIKVKLSILIFMSMETLTWRAAENMFPRRLDWLHATCSPIGTKGIDHTTLFDFYNRLSEDTSTKQLFYDLTHTFIDELGISIKKQRTDSFFTHGWLATLSRYGLFKETIRSFLLNLRKHQSDLYEGIKKTLSYDYLKESFDLTEKDKHQAQVRIQSMAQELYRLKAAFENHEVVKTYQSFKTLVTVFEQQCDIKDELSTRDKTAVVNTNSGNPPDTIHSESGTTGIEHSEPQIPDIQIKEKPTGDQIISTPHNLGATYTRKRKQKVVGHKSFVTETCDPDNPVQMVTDVNLEAATHSDANEIIPIIERLADNQLGAKIMHGDAGFVNGESILMAAGESVSLEGPSAGRSQSIEGFEKADRALDIADFKVNVETKADMPEVIACPKGQSPIKQEISDYNWSYQYRFDHESCTACELAKRCPVKIGKRVATLTFTEAQLAGSQRHHRYMSDSSYRKECAVRSGAESLVNEIANSHGARKSKHRTEKRTRLQLTFSAIGCNVKRYINHMERSVQTSALAPKTV